MQNTIYTSHLLITVALLEEEPGSAYKVHKQKSYMLYIHTSTVAILYHYIGAVMRDLTVDS